LVIGAYANNYLVAYIGLFGFFIMFLFQLITLPVEFNASRRALRALEEDGVLSDEELKGAKKVLSAAALTYVAAMLVALMQFLRLLMILGNNRGRRS
jgi:Zn-dependent membrane protease YugP